MFDTPLTALAFVERAKEKNQHANTIQSKYIILKLNKYSNAFLDIFDAFIDCDVTFRGGKQFVIYIGGIKSASVN